MEARILLVSSFAVLYLVLVTSFSPHNSQTRHTDDHAHSTEKMEVVSRAEAGLRLSLGSLLAEKRISKEQIIDAIKVLWVLQWSCHCINPRSLTLPPHPLSFSLSFSLSLFSLFLFL